MLFKKSKFCASEHYLKKLIYYSLFIRPRNCKLRNYNILFTPCELNQSTFDKTLKFVMNPKVNLICLPPPPLSCDVTSPPPLPPKRKSHNRSSSSTAPLYPQHSCHSPRLCGEEDGSSPSLEFLSSSGFSAMSGAHSVSSSCSLNYCNVSASNGCRRSSGSYGGDALTHSGGDALTHGSNGCRGSHNGLDTSVDSCRLSATSTPLTNTSSPSQMSPASSLDSFHASDTVR